MRNRRNLSGWLLTSMLILSFCSLPEAAAQAQDHAVQKLKVVVFGGDRKSTSLNSSHRR